MYFLIEQQWFYRAYLFICFAFPEKRQQFPFTVYNTVNKPFFVTWKNPSKKTRSPFSLEIQSNTVPLHVPSTWHGRVDVLMKSQHMTTKLRHLISKTIPKYSQHFRYSSCLVSQRNCFHSWSKVTKKMFILCKACNRTKLYICSV